MPKTVQQLESTACLYWPSYLLRKAGEVSAVPLLVSTQDQFLSILKSSDRTPEAWVSTLTEASTLPANLFLKHLMVLSDIGGEKIQRIAKDFAILFPENKMIFMWNTVRYSYTFDKKDRAWTNKSLNIDKSLVGQSSPLSRDMKDVAMIIMWGSNIISNSGIPQELFDKCIIGNFLGKPGRLEQFVMERYIHVSRITGGSTSNDLGHACEAYVRSYVKSRLPSTFALGGRNIEGISHNNANLTT